MDASLENRLKQRARADGFDVLAVTDASLPDHVGADLEEFLKAGYHGSMDWLPAQAARRKSPAAMWPAARSAILLGLNYAPAIDPLKRLEARDKAVISVYALNRDYHDIVKGRLKQLAHWFGTETGSEVRVFVDTAPLMEKPLAQRAGLGWQGKHTNLVSREFGSWLFIGVILTDALLDSADEETDHCGNCRRCLDICPTKAFPKPYQLDARRCISYLTIEHKGHIAREFRAAMGNRIYGCDDCLAVCPWNKFAETAKEAKLKAREDLLAPGLADLAQLDDARFRKLFSASPVKRTGRDRFVRNVLIALGNAGDSRLIPVARKCLEDHSPLVRAMAVWALGRLCKVEEFRSLKIRHAETETDRHVRSEWREALQ